MISQANGIHEFTSLQAENSGTLLGGSQAKFLLCISPRSCTRSLELQPQKWPDLLHYFTGKLREISKPIKLKSLSWNSGASSEWGWATSIHTPHTAKIPSSQIHIPQLPYIWPSFTTSQLRLEKMPSQANKTQTDIRMKSPRFQEEDGLSSCSAKLPEAITTVCNCHHSNNLASWICY